MNYPIRKGNKIIFRNTGQQTGFTLRNQERELRDFDTDDIAAYLDDMLVTENQFVVLSAPEAQDHIRFVQATVHADGSLEVELGIEKEGTQLCYKICSEQECRRIFSDFYAGAFHPELSEYRPVKFCFP